MHSSETVQVQWATSEADESYSTNQFRRGHHQPHLATLKNDKENAGPVRPKSSGAKLLLSRGQRLQASSRYTTTLKSEKQHSLPESSSADNLARFLPGRKKQSKAGVPAILEQHQQQDSSAADDIMALVIAGSLKNRRGSATARSQNETLLRSTTHEDMVSVVSGKSGGVKSGRRIVVRDENFHSRNPISHPTTYPIEEPAFITSVNEKQIQLSTIDQQSFEEAEMAPQSPKH